MKKCYIFFEGLAFNVCFWLCKRPISCVASKKYIYNCDTVKLYNCLGLSDGVLRDATKASEI